MVVKEESPSKKHKKLKTAEASGDADAPVNTHSDVTPSDAGKKGKKRRISDAADLPVADVVTDSPKKKSKKKKLKKEDGAYTNGSNEQSESTGIPVDSMPENSNSPKKSKKKHKKNKGDAPADGPSEQAEPSEFPADSKPGKKQKKKHSEGAEDAAASNADGIAAEETATPADSEKKESRPKKGGSLMKPKNLAHEKRTVFVGNVPMKAKLREVTKFFAQFGKVESARLRSAARLDAKKPIRMAVITQRFNEDRSSINAYVRFATVADAEKAAAEANGQVFKEHRLRVNMALSVNMAPDPRLAVFVGGLSLYAEDDQLWKHFEECGAIGSVRIVRDQQSSVGKGIGYVNFSVAEAVPRALKLNGSELGGRTIRVQRCHATARPKVNAVTGKKLRKARPEGGKPAVKPQDDKLAPVNKFSGDATAESKSSLKKKKGAKKKERRPDGRSQKRGLAQSLSKTIAPIAKPVSVPVVAVGGVTPQNKKIKFDFGDDDGPADDKKKTSEKLKEIKIKKEAKRKKKAKESEAKKKKNLVEPLTNILPS